MEEKMEDKKNNKPSFCARLGYLLGCVVSSCLTILIGGVIVVLTVKALTVLLQWLF